MTTELTPTNSPGTDPATTVACEQLTQVLRDYYKGTEDLKDYQARIERAEADQESALSSQTLSDEEVAEEIAKLISLKAVLTARIERKQTDLAGLTSQLETAHPLAVQELGAVINSELDKRRVACTERLLAALDVDHESLATHETLALPQHTGSLTEFARSVREIARLQPTLFWGTKGPGIASAASVLLNNLKQFKELTSHGFEGKG